MADHLKVACVQLNAGPDIHENLKAAEPIIREAAGQGAQFIATPENTDQIRRYFKDRFASAGDMDTHPAIPFFFPN